MVHRLAVVALERFRKDVLRAAGKCPERCLFSWHQHRVDFARVFPAMEQFEQDKDLIRGKRYGHFSHAQRLPTRQADIRYCEPRRHGDTPDCRALPRSLRDRESRQETWKAYIPTQ